MNTVVGLLGMSDTSNFGDTISPRIVTQELSKRLAHLEFRMLAPFGWELPHAATGGAVIEPLGAPTAERRAELASQLDALIIGGGEIVHDRNHLFAARYALPAESQAATLEAVESRALSSWFIEGLGAAHEARCPTIWNCVGVPFVLTGDSQRAVCDSLARRSYISVRDDRSLARVRAAGVEADVAVVPDLGFLVPRLLPLRVLQRRRAVHHLMNWLPAGEYVLVQGNAATVPLVGQLCAAIDAALGETELAVVAIDTTRNLGRPAFVEAMMRRCPQPVRMVPGDLANEDVAALIEGARAVVSASVHASVTALAFGRPTVIVNVGDRSKLAALAELTGPACEMITDISDLPAALRKAVVSTTDGELVRVLQADLDTHFDRVAKVIEHAGSAESVGAIRAQRRQVVVAQELQALRRAHSVRSTQLVAERSAFAAAHEEQLVRAGELQSRLEATHETIAQLTGECADIHHQHELATHRINELESLVEEVRAERDDSVESSTGALRQVVALLDAAEQHGRDLRTQLDLTESALAEVYLTKTFRLTRLPRRVFGWLKR